MSTDAGCGSFSSKVESKGEQKSATEQVKDTAKDVYDSVTGGDKSHDSKSKPQEVNDAVKVDTSTRSDTTGGRPSDEYVQKVKEAAGAGGDKTSATETNV